MKLIVQIPCLNEEKTLPGTLADIPRRIEGVDVVEILVIDDGSSDRTSEIARAHGADHVVRFTANRGLARAFMAGLEASCALGADLIVNTDGDNQYRGADIPALIRPILDGRADMVVGDRQVETVAHFSRTKKRLQRFGSRIVRLLSRTTVPDTTSGFRAFSREAALSLDVITDYSYTLETLFQAGRRKLAIAHVPVGSNPKLRESRLFKSIPRYVIRSSASILRAWFMASPLKICVCASAILMIAAFVIGARFLWYYLKDGGAGHVQSLLLAAILAIIGFQCFVVGLVADLIAANRRLIESALLRIKRMDRGGGSRS